MGGPVDFFLNKGPNESKQVVEAPAFSLTKVLTGASIVIAPLSALVAKAFEGDEFKFTPTHIVVIATALLGFLAVAGAADVLARALAANGKQRSDAEAARRDTENLIPFAAGLRATVTDPDTDPNVTVLAATGGSRPYYLVKDKDGALSWVPTSKVTLRGP